MNYSTGKCCTIYDCYLRIRLPKNENILNYQKIQIMLSSISDSIIETLASSLNLYFVWLLYSDVRQFIAAAHSVSQ